MTSCNSYDGDYSSRGNGVEVNNNKRQSLRLNQSLTEACNSTTSYFGHITQSSGRLIHTHIL